MGLCHNVWLTQKFTHLQSSDVTSWSSPPATDIFGRPPSRSPLPAAVNGLGQDDATPLSSVSFGIAEFVQWVVCAQFTVQGWTGR